MNEIRLEIEDTVTGAQLTATPSQTGVSITVEDDNATVEFDLDAAHAYALARLIIDALDSPIPAVVLEGLVG